MGLDVELIQFYRCKELNTLLEKAAEVFDLIGFDFLLLAWTPAPGPSATMCANAVCVWDNFSERMGVHGADLRQAMDESMLTGLDQAREDTLARQAWQVAQSDLFQLHHDAPQSFFLTTYQRQLICDFGEPEWQDFMTYPVCKERDRVLMLSAKTQTPVSADMLASANKVVSVFSAAYRCLYSQSLTSTVGGAQSHPRDVLSSREVECLQWLALGKTLYEAATILGISERTLRFHVRNARERLGVATTVQAVVAAALVYGFDPNDTRRSVYTASRTVLRAV
ncbi:MAG: helix-turn-helix transcriptional regulator [Pseudomonadota bacterium]